MKLSLENGRIKVSVGKDADQFWAPKEGVDINEVFDLLKKFATEDNGATGRVMSGLRRLCSVVNEELSPKQTEDNAQTEDIVDKGNQDLPQNQGLQESTEQIQTPDPKPDASQDGTGGEAPKPSDSLEHPDQPSPSTQILNHDAEISLNEYMGRSTCQLNEADLNVSWRQTAQGLEVRINGQLYIYDPLDPDLTVQKVFDKVEKIGAHSKGKALGWLEAQRRAGNIRSYKVKDDENSPKSWQRKIEEKLKEEGAEIVNTMPSTDDYLTEFKVGEVPGSITANLYSGDWKFSCGDVKKEGVTLKALLDFIGTSGSIPKPVKEEKKTLTEVDPTPFHVMVKDKQSGKEVVDSKFATQEQADARVRDMKKAATQPDIYVKRG